MNELIGEWKATLTEAIFNHRWVLLEGYHEIGKEILRNKLEDKILLIAQRTGQRPKTIHYCIELAKAYPKLNSLPEGKNVSWYKITKTLPPYEKKSAKKKSKELKDITLDVEEQGVEGV